MQNIIKCKKNKNSKHILSDHDQKCPTVILFLIIYLIEFGAIFIFKSETGFCAVKPHVDLLCGLNTKKWEKLIYSNKRCETSLYNKIKVKRHFYNLVVFFRLLKLINISVWEGSTRNSHKIWVVFKRHVSNIFTDFKELWMSTDALSSFISSLH